MDGRQAALSVTLNAAAAACLVAIRSAAAALLKLTCRCPCVVCTTFRDTLTACDRFWFPVTALLFQACNYDLCKQRGCKTFLVRIQSGWGLGHDAASEPKGGGQGQYGTKGVGKLQADEMVLEIEGGIPMQQGGCTFHCSGSKQTESIAVAALYPTTGGCCAA